MLCIRLVISNVSNEQKMKKAQTLTSNKDHLKEEWFQWRKLFYILNFGVNIITLVVKDIDSQTKMHLEHT